MKNKTIEFYPTALTIAGSDSGGGAGIQADLRTFNALGVFGCTAITAVTAQNPHKVTGIEGLSPALVKAQIDAVCEDIPVKYAKSGMLFNQAVVEAAAEAAKRHNLFLIVDPVMVSTSNAVLLQPDAIECIKSKLLPQASWVTPNIPEMELLLHRKLVNERDYIEAAKEFCSIWQCAVLLKTGHDAKQQQAADIICKDGEIYRLTSPRIKDCHCAHGTGCTLSAALTASFALEFPWKRAVCEAKAFVLGSLREHVQIGKTVEAMYPPEEDYFDFVKLEKL